MSLLYLAIAIKDLNFLKKSPSLKKMVLQEKTLPGNKN